jgi:AraC-like DNA-binding protein
MERKFLDNAVSVRFFMPSPQLAPYISTYYLTEVSVPDGHEIVDWLHPEWANFRISDRPGIRAAIGDAPLVDCPRLIVTGPTSFSAQFRTGAARIWGVGLLPTGWARLLGIPASSYVDRSVDGETDPGLAAIAPLARQLFGPEPDPQAEAARIDAHLAALLSATTPNDDEAKIRIAHTALIDEDLRAVAELSARLGMSSRSLERFSLKAFGFSPKLLLRRQRFLRSLAQFMLDPSLTWIRTLDTHYVDQAHFVRDFRRFMTMSPSQYGAMDHPVLGAAARARTVAAGAAVQALHQP